MVVEYDVNTIIYSEYVSRTIFRLCIQFRHKLCMFLLALPLPASLADLLVTRWSAELPQSLEKDTVFALVASAVFPPCVFVELGWPPKTRPKSDPCFVHELDIEDFEGCHHATSLALLLVMRMLKPENAQQQSDMKEEMKMMIGSWWACMYSKRCYCTEWRFSFFMGYDGQAKKLVIMILWLYRYNMVLECTKYRKNRPTEAVRTCVRP